MFRMSGVRGVDRKCVACTEIIRRRQPQMIDCLIEEIGTKKFLNDGTALE